VDQEVLAAAGHEHAQYLGQAGRPLTEPGDVRPGGWADPCRDEGLDRPVDLAEIDLQAGAGDDAAFAQ